MLEQEYTLSAMTRHCPAHDTTLSNTCSWIPGRNVDQVSLQSHVIIDTWQVRCTYLFESHVPKMFTGEYWKWVAWVSHDKIQRVKIPTPLLFKAGEPSVQGEHDTARPRWPHSGLVGPSLFKEKSLNRYHWTLPCCGSHSVSASVGYETACGCIWNSV